LILFLIKKTLKNSILYSLVIVSLPNYFPLNSPEKAISMPIALEVESNHARKVDFERKTEEKKM